MLESGRVVRQGIHPNLQLARPTISPSAKRQVNAVRNTRRVCVPVNVLAPFPGAEDAAETTRDLKKLKTITGMWSIFETYRFLPGRIGAGIVC